MHRVEVYSPGITFAGSSDPDFYPDAKIWRRLLWESYRQYQQQQRYQLRNVPHPRIQAQMLQHAARRYGPQNR